MLAKLDGLSEFDRRRPLTPSGTNLLGLVKHLAGIEFGYLGDSVGRPGPLLPWYEDGSVWDNGDMWAKVDEPSDYLIGLYRQAWAHSDESLDTLPLDAPARVAWWPDERADTTLGSLHEPIAVRDGSGRPRQWPRYDAGGMPGCSSPNRP